MVIQTGTIRKLGCGFLFAFHSNYGSILHQFQDKARYWYKIVIFSYPLQSTPPLGGHRCNIYIPFGTVKLEWWGYPMVKKLLRTCMFRLNTGVWQADGQTGRRTYILPWHSPRYAYALRGKNEKDALDGLWVRQNLFLVQHIFIFRLQKNPLNRFSQNLIWQYSAGLNHIFQILY